MKIIFLFLTIVLPAWTGVFAQGQLLTIEMKNASLEDIIWEIKNQSELIFLYSSEDIDDINNLSLSVQNATVDEVLKLALKNTDIQFQKFNNAVALQKKEKLPVYRDIKGQITDSKGITLPGVSVMMKETGTGVVSDSEGNYSISVPDKPTTLQFSSVGMKRKEIVVKTRSKLDVVMQYSSEKLDEIIVSISTGFQKIDKKMFSGAATKIEAIDALLTGEPDIAKVLEGKVAGVTVQTVSGTFGTSPKIRIRGASSIFGNQKPLWVVDGIMLEDVIDVSPDMLSSGDAYTLISSSVAGINSFDIESFDILKDGSATAMYGARAMNGVIVVTTKKGEKGKPRIEYNGEYTMRIKPSYRDHNIMNSQQQMSVYKELENKGWLNHSDVLRVSNGGIYTKMYSLINSYDSSSGKFGLANTPEAKTKFLQEYEKANTDWFDVLFTNSLVQNHSVSIYSGTDYSKYYFSTSLYNDNGWSIADKVTRYTANVRGNFDINKNLKLDITIGGSVRYQKAPGTLNRDENTVNGAKKRDFDINPYTYALNTSRALRPYDSNGNLEYFRMNYAPFNIINELNNNYIDLNVQDIKAQVNLSYKILNKIDYNLVFAGRSVKSTSEHIVKEKSNMAMAYRAYDNSFVIDNNPLLFVNVEDPDALPVVVLPKGGFYNREDNTMQNYYFRNSFAWSDIFDEKHIVHLFAGQDLNYVNRQKAFFTGVGQQYESGKKPFIDYRIIKQMLQQGIDYYGVSETYDRSVALFGELSYSYNGKYTVRGTYRYDGSNRLGVSKSARWLPTWNISGAWNIHHENFMVNSPVISHLTLRSAYALNASMGAGSNSSMVLRNMVTERPFDSDKESRMYISALENSELTWEKQYETNLGLDLGLFNNRINLQVDLYHREGFDLMGWMKTSGIGGQYWKFANYADMISDGIEILLNTNNLNINKFNWRTNITFSYHENKITNLKSSPQIYDLIHHTGGAKEGYPVRSLFSYQFRGIDKNGLPTFVDDKGNITGSDINFQSEKTDYLKYEGSVDPKIIGGVSNVFSWGNWTLNSFFTGQFGNKIRLVPSFEARYSDLNAMPKEFNDRWLMSGDEKSTNIPKILDHREYNSSYISAYNAYNMSSERVADGSFIRLKEVSLKYKLPERWSSKIGIKKMSIKAQATNLFLIYADKKLNGQDPEFYSSGGVSMPIPRQFTVSLNIKY